MNNIIVTSSNAIVVDHWIDRQGRPAHPDRPIGQGLRRPGRVPPAAEWRPHAATGRPAGNRIAGLAGPG